MASGDISIVSSAPVDVTAGPGMYEIRKRWTAEAVAAAGFTVLGGGARIYDETFRFSVNKGMVSLVESYPDSSGPTQKWVAVGLIDGPFGSASSAKLVAFAVVRED